MRFIFTLLATLLSSQLAFAQTSTCNVSYDINGDNKINELDYEIFRLAVGSSSKFADFDCSGFVNARDASLLRVRLGQCAPDYDLNGDGLIDWRDFDVLKVMNGFQVKAGDFNCSGGVINGDDFNLLIKRLNGGVTPTPTVVPVTPTPTPTPVNPYYPLVEISPYTLYLKSSSNSSSVLINTYVQIFNAYHVEAELLWSETDPTVDVNAKFFVVQSKIVPTIMGTTQFFEFQVTNSGYYKVRVRGYNNNYQVTLRESSNVVNIQVNQSPVVPPIVTLTPTPMPMPVVK